MARTRAPAVCSVHGCLNDQPCPEHKREPWAGSDRSARLPNGWAKIRQQVLRRDHHTCQHCHGLRCHNVDLEVDHITPGDNHHMSNLQTLGRSCHLAKTLTEAANARRR